MPENDKPILVYSTFPSAEEAERVGAMLVEQALAACVNILSGMTSIYMWEGNRERTCEVAMLIKTRAGLADDVIALVRAQHSYDNPALLVLPVDGGSAAFLDWIANATTVPWHR